MTCPRRVATIFPKVGAPLINRPTGRNMKLVRRLADVVYMIRVFRLLLVFNTHMVTLLDSADPLPPCGMLIHKLWTTCIYRLLAPPPI